MPKSSHIHKLKRAKLGKAIIYKCVLDDCGSFWLASLVEGKKSICSRCGFPFIISKRTLKNCPANPHCENCYKNSNLDKGLEEKLDNILDSIIVE